MAAEEIKTSDRVTRFPPEPNGFLHLGHLKAMIFDFELFKGGSDKCILRMDDTNPEAEKQEYVDAIIEDVNWLGYKYDKITYTSDYFDKLYEFAIDLIKMNKAYVDFSSAQEVKNMRHEGIESKYRINNTIDDNLRFFNEMKLGLHDENSVTLRLKIDMNHDNHSLRDPIAYRIKYTPHYRTKTKWCIYPSYDYSHGLIDALEGITDSFCTMEFFVRRELYYWPVNMLAEKHNLRPATVLEFGRLNIEGVPLSKRKIVPLVTNKTISGFDDPRLYTIKGLKRRGFTPEILKNIVSHTGMNRTPSTISRALIDHELRNVLEKTSDRVFAVIDPITVLVTHDIIDINPNDDNTKLIEAICSSKYSKDCEHPNHPQNKERGAHMTKLTDMVYIEKSDFRDVDDPTYYRLAPNKTIRFRYADFVKYICHFHDVDKSPIVIVSDHKKYYPEKPKKIKGIIHWLSSDSPMIIVEMYDNLYTTAGEINAASKINRKTGHIEQYAYDMITTDAAITVFQFERLGYFKFDRYDDDNVNGTKIPVFIQIIDLVDSYSVDAKKY